MYSAAIPFSFVENEYFRKFLKLIRPTYTAPSRKQIATSLLNKEYDVIKKTIDEKISSSNTIVIMLDGWTDINGISLINVVLGIPDIIFFRAIDSKTESHTGEYIFKVISDVIEEVGPLKVQAVVTDNAASMKLSLKLLESKYPHLITYGCAAHGLHLMIKDLSKLPLFSRVQAMSKSIIQFYKNKHYPKQLLKQIQIDQIGKEITLKTMVETRWGSFYQSLDSLRKNKAFLEAATVNPKIQIDSTTRKYILDENTFWPEMEKALKLLEPISKAIESLEGDKQYVSKVHSELKVIKSAINECVQLFSTKEQLQIEKIYEDRHRFMSHNVQIAAYFLNPTYHGKLEEEEINNAIQYIMEFSKTKMGLNEMAVLCDIADYRAKNSLWSNPYIWEATKAVDALTWWKGLCETKILSQVAIKILSLPPTSASCERNWKNFSLVKTKKRNRLSIETTEKLVYIMQNIKLIDKSEDLTRVKEFLRQNHISLDEENITEVQEEDENDTDDSEEQLINMVTDTEYESSEDISDHEETGINQPETAYCTDQMIVPEDYNSDNEETEISQTMSENYTEPVEEPEDSVTVLNVPGKFKIFTMDEWLKCKTPSTNENIDVVEEAKYTSPGIPEASTSIDLL